ncbi:NfeD family protein [Oceanobacillus sp. CFH 90083]|uniref:NfeD family protein n=1 Tax=Oceanobacillus sp. CFH 90083 TaxID=2592336 RepID=UPI00128B55C3|nr:NfeD family protein [Oceanobacillus sp. CFH 90083]
MDIVEFQWIGFLALFFGTLFILGEIFVNMRGIFGVLGLGFITVYFTIYTETNSVLLMFIIYFLGILLIIIDGKVLNDGTLATIGLVLMIVAVALPQPDLASGLYAVISIIVGSFSSLVFLKVFKRRQMWTKIALVDQLTKEQGYSSLSKEYEDLLGEEGVALTDFRPSGTIEVNKKHYSAVSGGRWIKKGTRIKVVAVDGTSVRVEELQED